MQTRLLSDRVPLCSVLRSAALRAVSSRRAMPVDGSANGRLKAHPRIHAAIALQAAVRGIRARRELGLAELSTVLAANLPSPELVAASYCAAHMKHVADDWVHEKSSAVLVEREDYRSYLEELNAKRSKMLKSVECLERNHYYAEATQQREIRRQIKVKRANLSELDDQIALLQQPGAISAMRLTGLEGKAWNMEKKLPRRSVTGAGIVLGAPPTGDGTPKEAPLDSDQIPVPTPDEAMDYFVKISHAMSHSVSEPPIPTVAVKLTVDPIWSDGTVQTDGSLSLPYRVSLSRPGSGRNAAHPPPPPASTINISAPLPRVRVALQLTLSNAHSSEDAKAIASGPQAGPQRSPSPRLTTALVSTKAPSRSEVRAAYVHAVASDENEFAHQIALRLLLRADLATQDLTATTLRKLKLDLARFTLQRNVSSRAVIRALNSERRQALRHFVGMLTFLSALTVIGTNAGPSPWHPDRSSSDLMCTSTVLPITPHHSPSIPDHASRGSRPPKRGVISLFRNLLDLTSLDFT